MDTSRLEAFSDGVFAIAITLLVLEIEVPPSDAQLGQELLALWPSYVAYATSFIVIGNIWINHHAMFALIARADHALLLLNTLHLMFISFIPFPTAVLARALHDHAGQEVATAFYGGVLCVTGILVTLIWFHAHRHHLVTGDVSRDSAKWNTRRFFIGPIGYGIGAVVALMAPVIALTFYIALNIFFIWPRHSRRVNDNAG